MDLGKLDSISAANQGFEIQLYHPGSKEDLGIFITVLGKDSDAHRKLFQAQQRRRVEKMTKGGGVRIAGGLAPEVLEQEANDLLAVCTKSWRTSEADKDDPKLEHVKPVLLLNGEELACTRENAVRVYREYPWIKEQVDDAVNDRANFLKR